MQPMQLCICYTRQFEKTFENSLCRKIVHMQLMRLHISSLRRFEKTFENSHWKSHWNATKATIVASVLARNLRRHLKTYSGKKSLKCNQCDNAFVQTGSLPTSENSLPRKVVQLQPMQLCICFGRHFEKTFENSLWKKIVQIQPMRLWICSGRQFQKTLENSLLSTVEKCWDEPKEHCTITTYHCFFRSVFRRGLAIRLPREGCP